jgi:hypothetical protein
MTRLSANVASLNRSWQRLGLFGADVGLDSDNLLPIDLVTANGQLLTTSATEHADLFWGLRGGGGNFGVVASFEYQFHRVARYWPVSSSIRSRMPRQSSHSLAPPVSAAASCFSLDTGHRLEY